MSIYIWFLVLILQSAAFTWVSRARNSGSVTYHSVASVFSNGVWFISQLFLIGFMAKPDMPLNQLVLYGAVYITGTTLGGTLMHIISLKWLERGKRKVGA